MTTITGEIKVIKDYGADGKHNWFTVINDAEGIEHKAYSNANLSEFQKVHLILNLLKVFAQISQYVQKCFEAYNVETGGKPSTWFSPGDS